ncbi:MAG: hypothetical protein BroJett011_77110 [Chloroflexota bacterium]|nr:MAG: hypothetical protein BroJett011_77110 [Chloroflexota bacterium]
MLLRLADEAEKNDFTNSQLCEAIGSVPGVEATGLTADIADTNASEVTEDNKLSKRD